jgi:hypothetical protein
MGEILECSMRVSAEKDRRSASIRNRKWDDWNALVEKTTRSVRKVAVESPIRIATGRYPIRRTKSASDDMMIAAASATLAASAAAVTANAGPVLFLGGEETKRISPRRRVPLSKVEIDRNTSITKIQHRNLPPRSPPPILKSPVNGAMRMNQVEISPNQVSVRDGVRKTKKFPISMDPTKKNQNGTQSPMERRPQLWRSNSERFNLQK